MKLFLKIVVVLLVSVWTSFGQGQINANPTQAIGVFLTVSDPTINGGNPVRVGTNAVGVGFASSVGIGQVTVRLYAAVDGTSLGSLESSIPIVTIQNITGTIPQVQGTFNAGSALYLTTTTTSNPNGGIAVPGWNGSGPLEFIFSAVSSDGFYAGWSGEATGIVVGSGINTPTVIFGSGAGQINAFNITRGGDISPVPEPTTLAIGGLGGLIWVLRRKLA